MAPLQQAPQVRQIGDCAVASRDCRGGLCAHSPSRHQSPSARPPPPSPAMTQNGASSVRLGLPSCSLQLCHHSRPCLCSKPRREPTNQQTALDEPGSSALSVTQNKVAPPLGPPSAAGPTITEDGAYAVCLGCHLLANIVLKWAEPHSPSFGPIPAAVLSFKMASAQQDSSATCWPINSTRWAGVCTPPCPHVTQNMSAFPSGLKAPP